MHIKSCKIIVKYAFSGIYNSDISARLAAIIYNNQAIGRYVPNLSYARSDRWSVQAIAATSYRYNATDGGARTLRNSDCTLCETLSQHRNANAAIN